MEFDILAKNSFNKNYGDFDFRSDSILLIFIVFMNRK